MQEIQNSTQYADLKAHLGSRLMVLDCSATWCRPCKEMKPFVAELAQQYPNVVFAVVNVDQWPDFPDALDVTSVPTFKFYRDQCWLPGFHGARKQTLASYVSLYSKKTAGSS